MFERFQRNEWVWKCAVWLWNSFFLGRCAELNDPSICRAWDFVAQDIMDNDAIFSPMYWHTLAREEYNIGNNHRSFRAHFGTGPTVCSQVWNRMIEPVRDEVIAGLKPVHLLWALHFLKTYDTMDILASKAQVDRKTYAKWTWTVLRLIRRYRKRIVGSINVGVVPPKCASLTW